MKFETASQTAIRLGVNIRTVQKWAKQGKLKGAEKVGRDWMIPENAMPSDEQPVNNDTVSGLFMPLAMSYSSLGNAKEFIKKIENEDERKIALGEYYYHKGECEKAVITLEEYLDSEADNYRFAASIICFFSYLSLGHKHQAQYTLNSLDEQLRKIYNMEQKENIAAKGVFTCCLLSTRLHFTSDRIPSLEGHVNHLKDGVKALALYLIAYQAYLDKDYSRAYGIAEATLIVCPQEFTVALIHIHIISAVSLMNLTKVKKAKEHLVKAWEIASADEFYQPFAEHHSVLHGLLESYIKKEHPEEFAHIIENAKNYGKSWKTLYNELNNKTVAEELTTTEFVVATLYYHNWRIKEIADHMHLSERTIKNYLQIIYQKLGINGKKGLEEYMLQ